ncbi:hypothetical protein M153_4180005224 [Pseudoloma neurophilia]|uniref:Transposable element n=1 Tax=Pseudoloma neurophilia TaxID=146866 RepID=A0A0R0M360_9MICR|nr:hypothetical protein M153_4180005224 [Pseudoloma neurophilia]
MVMKKTKDTKIGYNWRCLNYLCQKYQTTKSLVFESFFESFKCVRSTLAAMIHLSQDVKIEKVAIFSKLSKNTILKLKNELPIRMRIYFERNPVRLGGQEVIIQCDETMLNHKIKPHRGAHQQSRFVNLSLLIRVSRQRVDMLK